MHATWPSIDHSILSPSGHVSKRARDAAMAREAARLFPEGSNFLAPQVQQPTEAERLRRHAAELRGLAERGMKPRAYAKLASELEAKAAALD